MNVLQIKITLDQIKPKIWRRFLVKDSISFQELHNIIQIVMGWDNYHLFSFDMKGTTVGIPDPDYDYEVLNAKKIKLKDKLSLKMKFRYIYDFGDDWNHTLIVEKILDGKNVIECPICLAGERACAPEDCGGVSGYYELAEIKKNKKHPEYKELIVDWLGEDFDFESFDINEINKLLRQRIKVDGRTRYWVKNETESYQNEKDENENFWSDETFYETLGSEDLKEKMKSFHKKHNEDMNFNCSKCNKKISAHNKDWHAGMCDDCFNKKFFPKD